MTLGGGSLECFCCLAMTLFIPVEQHKWSVRGVACWANRSRVTPFLAWSNAAQRQAHVASESLKAGAIFVVVAMRIQVVVHIKSNA